MDSSCTNPFYLEDNGSGVADHPIAEGRDGKEVQLSERPSPEGAARVSYEDIASQLLADGFLLTALELHTELQELGRPVSTLRDYFSNPGNFEKARQSELYSQSPPMALQRSGSIQTFDSLEWDRYTDDGTGDRIAALEFELRKAHDQVKSLRKALTLATEKDVCNTQEDSNSLSANNPTEDEVIKPHVKRAINFLVNEYLLIHDYKLTSVTFAEENEKQDFENWDDVGLNIAKPPDLRHLYLDFGKHSSPQVSTANAETQVNLLVDELEAYKRDLSSTSVELETVSDERDSLLERNSVLGEQAAALEADKVELSNRLETLTSEMETEIVERQSLLYSQQSQSHSTYKHQTTSRSISTSFLNKLLNMTYQPSTDNRIAYQVSLIDKNEVNTILDVISQSLPHIIPNVLLQKREELLPLILCSANLHPSERARDAMLASLFNLIKRPDADQRKMILAGCQMFAQYNGPDRVESELLPQCWEQINDKYQERRLLVAEACCVLIPYISPAMRGSLVLSMLQQMLVEEKVELVKGAVVTSLSVLISFMDDSDKYPQILGIYTHQLLADPGTGVDSYTTGLFLPSLALWAMELGKLPQLTDHVINSLQNSLSEPNDENELSVIEPKFSQSLKHFTILSHFLLVSMVTSGPYTDSLNPEKEVSPLPERLTSCSDSLDAPLNLVTDTDLFSRQYSAFLVSTSEEWYKTWDGFELLIYTLFSKLTTVLLSVQEQTSQVLHQVVELVHKICRFVGRYVTLDKVSPRLGEFFRPDEVIIPQQYKIYTSLLLPVYLCGIHAAFTEPDDVSGLCATVGRYLRGLSGSGVPVSGLLLAFQYLINLGDEVAESLLDSLWDLVKSESVVMRVNLVSLYQVACRELSQTLFLSRKILPALLTLTRDEEVSVRAACVGVLGELLILTREADSLQKISVELNTLLESPEVPTQTELQIALIDMFNKIGPNTEPHFRDGVIFLMLSKWSQLNNRCADTIKRRDVSLRLFQAYCSLSCCFIANSVIEQLLLPGLQCLLQDLKELGLDGTQVVQSMIKDFESKLPSANDRAAASSSQREAATGVGSPREARKGGLEKAAKIEMSGMVKVTNFFSKKK